MALPPTPVGGFRRPVDVGCQVTDFHEDRIVGMTNVNCYSRMGFCQAAADFLGQLNGGHGEHLVGTLGLHLEGTGAVQVLTQIVLNCLKNGIAVLLTGTAAA